AKKIIKRNGYDYSVTVAVTGSFFPTKTYGDVTFPAGDYEALRIVIGDGDGQNWWCVMFPPLCFVDVTKGTVPDEDKEELKAATSEKEYKLLSDEDRKSDVTVNIRFKIVEWWQKKLHKEKEQNEKQKGAYVAAEQEEADENDSVWGNWFFKGYKAES
ncbi:MAG: stage II sporulation protein R, partial [Clostridiales bacterium]|nr:stage II sporulation protein R [Clostridiales bacterium]